jgi:glucose/arabinose dehydrogenase
MGRAGALMCLCLLAAGCGGSSPRASGSTTTTVAAGPVHAVFRKVAYLNDPIALVTRPHSPFLYGADKSGAVWAFRTKGTNLALVGTDPILDVSHDIVATGSEQGLLGIAFSPDGTSLYVDETAKGGTAGITKVIRYAMSGDDVTRSSATTIFSVDQPYVNHNGGEVVFGPDGALYVGLGDGGSEGDPLNYGQNPDVPLAKILRMNADGSDRSTWVMGARNPWRFSFDPPTGDLWIGDVGGGLEEEVDHLPGGGPTSPGGRGANLGWSLREGTVDSDKKGNRSGFTDPVYEYSHDDGGCAIVGGYVYRGSAIPALVGRYVFGDDCLKTAQALDPARPASAVTIATGDPQLTSFAVDNQGELYALSLSGPIYRLEPST